MASALAKLNLAERRHYFRDKNDFQDNWNRESVPYLLFESLNFVLQLLDFRSLSLLELVKSIKTGFESSLELFLLLVPGFCLGFQFPIQ